ncbi:Oidioi.mRNA.OKI2018_I69.PAR.g12671.t1.cds [Oikopleura dioica]|uniref:Oidioi.mRNA.OKI2018_I69.PAR.g12671.t1.cds n=1 Tax=Oikopleura dioica TaxID=34765 RepID=A0ABN7S6K3_OIKDI|nr:Oidioi.mRNA.OKI2018_I69.PAR.g12671.t1.cds [Oikopleura dioica]
MDFFGDESAAAQPAVQATSDPAADFLSGEQSEIANIEGAVYDEPPAQAEASNDFDPFGAGEAPAGEGAETEPVTAAAETADEEFLFEQATVQAPVEEMSNLEVAAEPEPIALSQPEPVYTMPVMEPESIKLWREQFKTRIEDIETDASAQEQIWKDEAKEQIKKFYKEREQKLAANKARNREDPNALKLEQENFDPTEGMTDQEKWEKVTARIDFNAKDKMKEAKESEEIRFLKRYLAKHGRLRTLKALNKDLERKKKKDERKPIALSFTILKAPKRKIEELAPVKPKKKAKDGEEEKTVTIPKEFKKLAKNFGLPEKQLEFFYENRSSFNWEYKMEEAEESEEIRFVKKYLAKNGRLRALKALNKDLERKKKNDERKPVTLSFAIQKASDGKRENAEGREAKKGSTEAKKVEEKENASISKDADQNSNKKNADNVGRKPVSLSFTILKAPKRKIEELAPVKPKKSMVKKAKDVDEEKRVTIPKEFKILAKNFGLPEEHLEFFYENRSSFNWECKDTTEIHCAEKNCNFKMKASKGCLMRWVFLFLSLSASSESEDNTDPATDASPLPTSSPSNLTSTTYGFGDVLG